MSKWHEKYLGYRHMQIEKKHIEEVKNIGIFYVK